MQPPWATLDVDSEIPELRGKSIFNNIKMRKIISFGSSETGLGKLIGNNGSGMFVSFVGDFGGVGEDCSGC